jgi:lipoate-protein ligase A
VRKAEQDLEVSRELNKCVKRDFEREKMKTKGVAVPEEKVHEVEKLKKLLLSKKEVIKKLRDENEELMKDAFS